MNRREAAIIAAYTGINLGDFATFHKYAEEKLGFPVHSSTMAEHWFWPVLKEKSKDDFINLCGSLTDE
jgi:hypothetical protein